MRDFKFFNDHRQPTAGAPEVVAYAPFFEVSDADTYQAICDTLERVWLELTDSMQRSYLEKHQIPDWVDTLQWAIKALPEGYEKHRDIIQADLKEHQHRLTKTKKTKRKEGIPE